MDWDGNRLQGAEVEEWWGVKAARTEIHYKIPSGFFGLILELYCARGELLFKQAEWDIQLYREQQKYAEATKMQKREIKLGVKKFNVELAMSSY